MTTLALVALCLLGPAQGKTLLEQVAPKPTGKNGYEEYLRAADIVNSDEARLYLEWRPGRSRELEALSKRTVEYAKGMSERTNPEMDALLPLAKRLEGLSLLDVRREAVNRYGQALELVRQGNQKPVWDPRENPDWSTLLPEFSQFRVLARLAAAAAYVRDADGEGLRATETLNQALRMADKTSFSFLIGVLGGIAQESIVIGAFQERLPLLSQVEARRIVAFIGGRLAQPVSVKIALQREAVFVAKGVEQLLKEPELAFGSGGPYDAVKNRLRSLSPLEASTLVQRMRAMLAAKYPAVLARFDRAESEWGADDLGIGEPRILDPSVALEDLAEAIVGLMTPNVDHLGVAVSRSRAQLRLLRLAARVIEFRWEHERLPPMLEDAAPADEIADPLTGGKFQYTPMGDRFRVFSKGTPKTGEIDIKYVRPNRVAVPPPHPSPPTHGTHG